MLRCSVRSLSGVDYFQLINDDRIRVRGPKRKILRGRTDGETECLDGLPM